MNRFGPLYNIDHGAILLGFILGAALAIAARGVLQARVAAWLGDDTALRAGRGNPDLRQQVDVYAIVAWALGGLAWGHAALFGWRSAKRTRIVTALTGPIVMFVLVLAEWAAYRSVVSDAALNGTGSPGLAAQLLNTMAFVTAGMAVLACVPVPPLDGWPFLRAVTRGTPGMEKARYHLEERNIGLAIALALVVLPRLFVSLPDPLFSLATRIVDVANSVTGG